MLAFRLCRRRASTKENVYRITEGYVAHALCSLDDDDDDSKSTDTSGGSEHVVYSSSEDSDTDSTDLMPNSEASSAEDSGSDLRQGPIAHKIQRSCVKHGRTRRCCRPEPSQSVTDPDLSFCVARKLQNSAVRRIRRRRSLHPRVRRSPAEQSLSDEPKPIDEVISALDAWLAARSDDGACCEHKQIPSCSNNDAQSDGLLPTSCLDAMAKLAPHEIALMKLMLDVKLASH